MSLAESRGGAPCGVWGNAPTVFRALNSKEAANKGAGSEASLPVTLRSRRSAPNLLYLQLPHCRAKWVRPTSIGRRVLLSVLVFFVAGGIASAEANAEGVQRAIGKPSGSVAMTRLIEKSTLTVEKTAILYCCEEISPLRRRRGGFPVAPSTPSACTLPCLDFLITGGTAPAGVNSGVPPFSAPLLHKRPK